MPAIQFSHANGFPAPSYQYLFDCLTPYMVHYVPVMGAGAYRVESNWRPLVAELIADIEQNQTQSVIGIGHSMGAVITLWAAIERPDLFQRIILLDPPLFGWSKRLFIGLARKLGLIEKFVPVVKQAKVRRTQFASREEAFTYWQPKRLFRNFHPECFKDYVQYGLSPANAGLTLTIPREWEARYFQTTPSNMGSTALQMPSHYIYPTQSVLSTAELTAHRQTFSRTTFHEFNGGHMFPLEKPEEVASLIKQLIQ